MGSTEVSSAVFAVRRRDLAWAVALMLLLSAVWVARGDHAVAGGSPPGTGIAIVYVAVGTNYPDALGVGPGAGLNGAPIIILPTNPPIPGSTATELVRLDPRSVIIIGGTSAISDPMQDAIEALLPNAVVSRIAGTNRYDTNAAFSAATFPIETWISIPATAFTSQSPATDDASFWYEAADNNDGFLWAPLDLPHGAEVLELRARIFDTNLNDNITVNLLRTNFTTSDELASVTSEGQPAQETYIDESINFALVDNSEYAYHLILSGAFDNRALFSVSIRVRLGAP